MTSNYWRKREEAHIKKQVKSDKEISKEIERRLQLALDDIKKEIDANFANYSAREGISLPEAHKRASKMDVEAFARKAKDYVKTKDFSSEANYQLKIYNLTMRVSRLELLKAQIGLELVAMTNDLDKYLSNILTDDALAEFERQAGILGDTVSNNYKGAVDAIVNGSFNSATFSENIWRYQAELKAELDKLLVRQFAQGRNPRVMARYLRDKFDVTKGQAERLMRTESSRIQTEIQKKSYQDYEIDEYEYIAEPTACSICKPLDGKIFKVKNMEPGSNSTPMHPNCRCSTAPYVDRDKFEKELKERGL